MDMNMLTALASQTLLMLTPWMPYIGKAGEAVATKMGEAIATKAGEAAFEKAQETYNTIHERFAKEASTDNGASTRALASFVITPEDADTRELAEKKIVRILQNDPDFVADLEKFVASGPLMSVELGDDGIGEDITMRNDRPNGSQKIKGGDRTKFKNINLNIGSENSEKRDRK